MASKVFQIASAGLLAIALWIVPSVGTRGQGTLDDRFSHPDRGLIAADSATDREMLRQADAAVTSAVAGL